MAIWCAYYYSSIGTRFFSSLKNIVPAAAAAEKKKKPFIKKDTDLTRSQWRSAVPHLVLHGSKAMFDSPGGSSDSFFFLFFSLLEECGMAASGGWSLSLHIGPHILPDVLWPNCFGDTMHTHSQKKKKKKKKRKAWTFYNRLAQRSGLPLRLRYAYFPPAHPRASRTVKQHKGSAFRYYSLMPDCCCCCPWSSQW